MDEQPRHFELADSADSEVEAETDPETALESEPLELALLTAGVVVLLFVLFALAWHPSLLQGAGFGGTP